MYVLSSSTPASDERTLLSGQPTDEVDDAQLFPESPGQSESVPVLLDLPVGVAQLEQQLRVELEVGLDAEGFGHPEHLVEHRLQRELPQHGHHDVQQLGLDLQHDPVARLLLLEGVRLLQFLLDLGPHPLVVPMGLPLLLDLLGHLDHFPELLLGQLVLALQLLQAVEAVLVGGGRLGLLNDCLRVLELESGQTAPNVGADLGHLDLGLEVRAELLQDAQLDVFW